MTEAVDNFRRREEWLQNGKDFLVMVRRHEEKKVPTGTSFDREGPHRWCVYAYIYKGHPLFDQIDVKGDIFQDVFTQLPFHCGVSLFIPHLYAKDATVASFEVGADYHHLHDEAYTHMPTPAEAWTVFQDAQQLFVSLQALADNAASLTRSMEEGKE